MTPEKLIAVVEYYKQRLVAKAVLPARMDTRWTFAQLEPKQALSHALYLCYGIEEFVHDPQKWGKTNRHFNSIQICLSLAGWFTLDQLMEHNRPQPTDDDFQPKLPLGNIVDKMV